MYLNQARSVNFAHAPVEHTQCIGEVDIQQLDNVCGNLPGLVGTGEILDDGLNQAPYVSAEPVNVLAVTFPTLQRVD